MTTTGNIADVLFKDYLNVPFNKVGNPFFNEDAPFSSYVIGDQVLVEPIPRNPVFAETACPYPGVSAPGSFSKYEQDSTGVLERFERLKLTQVDLISGGSQAVRFVINGDPPLNLLSDALQFNYGESSSTDYALFVNNAIVARSNTAFGYIFNFRAGYLTFYGASIPTTAQFTGGNVEFTFVRYRGRKGVSNISSLEDRTLTIATDNGLAGGRAEPDDLSADRVWTLGLAGQSLAVHNLSTNGLIARTGAGAVAARSIDVSGNGISIVNGDGVAGNPLIEVTAGGTPEFGPTVAIGEAAGALGQSKFAVAVGIGAGNSSQGKNAIAVGVSAGRISQGDSSTAIGDQAGQVGQGPSAISIGQHAGRFGQREHSIAIGIGAGAGFDGGLAWTGGSGVPESSWQSVACAPELNDGRGRLVAVASSGPDRVMYSDDAGSNWVAVGVGNGVEESEWRSVTWAPELNAGSGRLIAVASSGANRVMYSDDGGESWTSVGSANGVIENEWRCIIWVYELNAGSGRLIALASSGTARVMYSDDGGISWASNVAFENPFDGPPVAIPESGWTSVAWIEPQVSLESGRLVAVAFSGTVRILASNDGLFWTRVPQDGPLNSLELRDIIFSRGRLIAVASSGASRVLYEDNFGNGAWQSVGSGGGVQPIDWMSLASLPGITTDEGRVVAVASAGAGSIRVMVSENNGDDWSDADYNTGVSAIGWQSVTSAMKSRGGRDTFVAVASSGTSGTSRAMVGESAASVLGSGEAENSFGDSSIAIGLKAGRFGNSESRNAIAIGRLAGQGLYGSSKGQGIGCVAIGDEAGRIDQGTQSALGLGERSDSIAIGSHAGELNQGRFCIAIGPYAGSFNQPNNTIILDASGFRVSGVPGQTGRFYVAPIREQAEENSLRYNATTREITYATQPNQPWVDATGGIAFVDGRVGIGTSTPHASSALDVSGNVTVDGRVGIGTSTPNASSALDVSGNVTVDGRVGIGTSTPHASSALDVSGNVTVDGRVGIGTSTPNASSALDVSGNVTVTGDMAVGGDITAFSDIALKRNVRPMEHALDLVMAMRPVYYEMKADGRRRVGFIAQEMERVVPEAVVSGPSTVWKSIAYGNLTCPIVGALQQVVKKLDAIEERLARLENSVG